MTFDQQTRNRLARFVGDARALLTEEFTRQLQQEYGLDPERGEVTDLTRLSHLDDARRETAALLRETLAYYLARHPKSDVKARQETLQRIVREQAFTVLNRLCALRMAESRALLIEAVGQGYRAKGFQLYSRLAGTGLGETGDAYRCFLFSLFDELALELPVLFDRYAPEGRLFPRPAALLDVLALINNPDIAPLWAEDETIGWIYQYFNSVEERRQMRAESQAPRNSRELAVRNQFFTPRYVVEFLTDNTLGRIWYEMTKGETSLKESCRYLVRRPTEVFLESSQWSVDSGQESVVSDQTDHTDHRLLTTDHTDHSDYSQEGLLRQPVYIPHRPLKDPRDILMLDPACGSMHFGLYAFDLYERIYEEAWDMQTSGQWSVVSRQTSVDSGQASVDSGQTDPSDSRPLTTDNRLLITDHRPLSTDYSSKEAFLADVPRLIIEHNIHGIDIDSRAVQIAGLSLWLRAQRSWQAQGVKPQDRPQIRRSNIVCAEPMPGDRALLEEFLKTLRDERLEGLIRRVLKVPANQRVRATPAMADALCDLVRTVWKEMALAGEAGSLLKIEEALADAVARGKAEWDEKMPLFRVTEFGLTEQADEKPTIRYYKTIPGEDADFWDQAEALVLGALQDYADRAENGGGYRRRLFAGDAARGFAFVDLCRRRYDTVVMNPPFGEAVARTTPGDVYSTFSGNVLCAFALRAVTMLRPAGLAGSVVDATVLTKSSYQSFRQELWYEAKKLELCANLGWGILDGANVEVGILLLRASVTSSHFLSLDARRSPEDVLMQCSLRGDLLQLTSSRRLVPVTDRLLRAIPNLAFPLTPDVLVHVGARKLSEAYATAKQGVAPVDSFRVMRLRLEVDANDLVFQRVWWTVNRGGEYSPFYRDFTEVVNWQDDGAELKADILRRYPYLSGNVAWVAKNEDFYGRAGLCYAKRTDFLSAQALPQGTMITVEGLGVYPRGDVDPFLVLGLLNTRSVAYILNTYCGQHKYSGYVDQIPVPALTSAEEQEISDLARKGYELTRILETKSELSPLFWLASFRPYGIAAGCAAMRAQNEVVLSRLEGVLARLDAITKDHWTDIATDAIRSYELDSTNYSPHTQCGYFLGLVFGRWDLRCATGEIRAPQALDPFAPLPVCSPSTLQNADGLPALHSDVPQDYPLRISWPGILVDDEGHLEDVERRVREVLQVIWKERAEAIEQEVCQLVGVRSLREYFRKPGLFFAEHVRRYSKSRRQAPIYWPLSTPSGSYTLWLYYHRLTDQTLYTCINDFVDPKLAVVSGQLAVLRRKSGRSREEERELEQLTDLEAELKDFRAELLRVAAFWKPNLNDGVQITAAPLWRLFQHRLWQRTLKETWEKLEAGEYDWAHLALSIWPGRVVPQCVTDRSLAIAHDVEDLFWVEDGGRWRNLDPPDAEFAEQVRRQQRPARESLRSGLAALTLGEGRGLRCVEVYAALAAGKWDDLAPARLLWPARVAEKCWDDPLLALTLRVQLPARPTKAGRARFVKEQVEAGCPDLVTAVEEALQDRPDRFAAFWAELARGDHDDLSLALALWSQRVVEKCAADVELAERHGLRRFLWAEDGRGGWRRRKARQQEIVDEVHRRAL